MKTAAIISEYNPFHRGHLLQIDKIREEFGNDTAVIAIMSGNYTQRGEIAITDKTIRAKAAVECGVNLVLELPFPYSMSSAEFFAKSGVHIADAIGVVDYICFGSESGDINTLKSVASVMLTDAFRNTLISLTEDKDLSALGHPKLCEMALKKLGVKTIDDTFFSPNNILSLEYIKALLERESKIIPITYKRVGAGYLDGLTENEDIQSASAIRTLLLSANNSALEYVPENARKIYLEAISDGKMPSNESLLDTAVISSLRLNAPDAESNIHDASGGLYNRLHTASMEAQGIQSLMTMTETKRYTKSRIKRTIWNCYFGVTSSDVRTPPSYAQVLAMDTLGRSVLKRIKKMSDFPIITKPSAYEEYGDTVIRQKALSNKADAIYGLTMKKQNSGLFPLTFTPYVKD